MCDDGNNMDGDGCSKDCSTIEVGFECPRWGVACNKKCGNGHREWEADPNNPGQFISSKYQRKSMTTATLGQIIDAVEECDMGIYNVDNDLSIDSYTKELNYYKHACNKDCMVTNKNLWKCTWVPDYDDATGLKIIGYHSHCEYLRGNRKVDNLANNPDMTIPETCDPGVQQWQA